MRALLNEKRLAMTGRVHQTEDLIFDFMRHDPGQSELRDEYISNTRTRCSENQNLYLGLKVECTYGMNKGMAGNAGSTCPEELQQHTENNKYYKNDITWC